MLFVGVEPMSTSGVALFWVEFASAFRCTALQEPGACEPGNATADDADLPAHVSRREYAWTKSTSVFTFPGSVVL